MDLNEIPRVPLIFGLLILALVAGVAGYSYMSGNSSQQAAVPVPAAEQPLTDEQMKENLENPTTDMNASADEVLDSDSIDSGTVSEDGTYTPVKKSTKKSVSAVASVKKPISHPTKPSKPANPKPSKPSKPTEPQNKPGQNDEGYYSDEPWDPLEPPAENPDAEGDYGGDDNPEEDNGGQGDLMP